MDDRLEKVSYMYGNGKKSEQPFCCFDFATVLVSCVHLRVDHCCRSWQGVLTAKIGGKESLGCPQNRVNLSDQLQPRTSSTSVAQVVRLGVCMQFGSSNKDHHSSPKSLMPQREKICIHMTDSLAARERENGRL